MAPILVPILALILAALVGVAIQNGGVCAVAAVRQLLAERRPDRFLSFVEAAGWTLGVLALADLAGLGGLSERGGTALGSGPLMGAAVFGMGAAINGGCAFGTLAWLGRGHLGYVATLPGLLAGAVIALNLIPALLPGTFPAMTMPASLPPPPPVAARPAALILALIAVSLLALWRGARAVQAVRAVRAGRRAAPGGDWPPALSMAVIGLASGGLLIWWESWTYTGLLVDLAGGEGTHLAVRVALAGAVIAGTVGAGCLLGRFRLRRIGPRQLLRHGMGGLLMGAGAALIPGGNDTLVLTGLPMLWPHGWACYALLIAGILLALPAMRRWMPG